MMVIRRADVLMRKTLRARLRCVNLWSEFFQTIFQLWSTGPTQDSAQQVGFPLSTGLAIRTLLG